MAVVENRFIERFYMLIIYGYLERYISGGSFSFYGSDNLKILCPADR